MTQVETFDLRGRQRARRVVDSSGAKGARRSSMLERTLGRRTLAAVGGGALGGVGTRGRVAADFGTRNRRDHDG